MMKRQSTEWENILEDYSSEKGLSLIYRQYKELSTIAENNLKWLINLN
jgi:hypothetical protein